MSDNEDYDDEVQDIEIDELEVDDGTKSPKSPVVGKGKQKPAKGGNKGKGKGKPVNKGGKTPTTPTVQTIKLTGKTNAASVISAATDKADNGKESYRSSTGVLVSDPLSRDVKIDGFTLTAWSQELISDSSIEFTIGRRYGLIGANGSGKTTFLKTLASREVPIPEHIDIFLLENEAPPTNYTGIQWIAAEVKSEIDRLEALAEQICEDLGPEAPQLQIVYDDIAKLEELNPETHAATLLYGLGFGPKMMAKPTKDMSGGWRMRVALAKALFVRPTLLLLDEPTNHLDLEACVWLENYLAKYDKCLVVNSHSQDFLNGVCTNIIELDHKQKLTVWTGNYDTFINSKRDLEVNQLKKYEKEQEDIKHIKAFIASCGTYANAVRQAKSKQKILDKMYAAGLTEKPSAPPSFNFSFAECDRLAPPVLQFHKVGFAYSGKKEDLLYTDVDLAVDMDSRVALVGPNGTGKSTLLKLMMGQLNPTVGDIRRHLDLRIGHYHQHSTAVLDLEMTPLEYIQSRFPEQKKDEEVWRGLIGRYGVSGKMQKQKIGHMSDGQRSRIVFCELALANPNVLLLDEPTNHLDMAAIDALAAAIRNFKGGVVLVSHDFRLISQVADTIWLCDKGNVKPFPGDIRAYKKWLVDEVENNQANFVKTLSK